VSAKIVERIVREARVPDLMEALAERLSLSDLQSLLLAVYQQRVERLAPRHLKRQYQRNRFVQAAQVSPKQLLEFDLLAYSLLPPDFQALELSPVCPLGSNSILAPVDQNNVVTTIRNTEVCSDSTSVLALECARRRRESHTLAGRPEGETKLCASHRVLRAQVFEGAASFPHFRIFVLCTAGRDQGGYQFETRALAEHTRFYLRLMLAARDVGYAVGGIRVALIVYEPAWRDALGAGFLASLAAEHPGIEFSDDPGGEDGRGYYMGARFQIHVRDRARTEYLIVDGGFTDWTQQLLSNQKERLLTSGLGSERFVYCFG
jgi:hypothetical protein